MNVVTKIALFVVLGGLVVWGGLKYNDKSEQDAAKEAAELAAQVAARQKTIMEQFKIEDIKVGTGEEVKVGDMITVHYKGMFTDGKVFESSREAGEPITIQIGAGAVIEGWDRGVPGMKIGGIRKLSIPAELAYGATGSGPIPPNTPIVFEIEMMSIARPTP